MSNSRFAPINEQMDQIRRGAVDLISEEELVKKLEESSKSGKPLIAKFGADPSSPDLHIGHGVPLQKLRTFQDLGHQAILIIGDFTAMIGDPSGRQKTRPMLTPEETAENARSYVDQVTKIVDGSTLKIQYNSTWLNAMNFSDVIKLAATYTVSQMLEREDFHKRFNDELPISLHEFLYPLAQGMDSVAIHSDIELGGTDQKFNLLVGRELQKHFGQRPQNILTTPILEGTDGERKMSKSYGNSINFNDTPDDMFGKAMSIPDALIYRYFELATSVPDLDGIKAALDDSETNPRNLKVRLGQELVRSFYGEDAAQGAYARFTTMFVKKEIPDDIPEIAVADGNYMLADFIAEHQLATSKSEARRLIQGGGVSIDGEKVTDERASFSPSSDGVVVKVGKRKFLKVVTR